MVFQLPADKLCALWVRSPCSFSVSCSLLALEPECADGRNLAKLITAFRVCILFAFSVVLMKLCIQPCPLYVSV